LFILNFNKNFYVDKFRISEEYFDVENQTTLNSFSEYKFAEEDASEYNEIIEEEKKFKIFITRQKTTFKKHLNHF